MGSQFGEYAFGIRDAKLTPLPSGSSTDLPRIRQLDCNITSDSSDLTGDDSQVAVHTFNTRVEGAIEAGGINPAAVAVLMGTTVVSTGTTPAAKKVVSLTSTTAAGYFKLEGQMIADDGGDFHVMLYKAKVTSGPSITFQGGEFALTACDILGVADSAGKIVDFTWNETAVANA